MFDSSVWMTDLSCALGKRDWRGGGLTGLDEIFCWQSCFTAQLWMKRKKIHTIKLMVLNTTDETASEQLQQCRQRICFFKDFFKSVSIRSSHAHMYIGNVIGRCNQSCSPYWPRRHQFLHDTDKCLKCLKKNVRDFKMVLRNLNLSLDNYCLFCHETQQRKQPYKPLL